MKLTDFLCAGRIWHKLKSDWKFLGWAWLKKGEASQMTLTLTVSEEWTDVINWFFACWYRFTKIKSWSNIFWMGMVKSGCCQSGHRNLKLTVSQNWADGINWFFACC